MADLKEQFYERWCTPDNPESVDMCNRIWEWLSEKLSQQSEQPNKQEPEQWKEENEDLVYQIIFQSGHQPDRMLAREIFEQCVSPLQSIISSLQDENAKLREALKTAIGTLKFTKGRLLRDGRTTNEIDHAIASTTELLSNKK